MERRCLKNLLRSFKVQYAAAMVILITIAMFGGGYRDGTARSEYEVTQNLHLQQEQFSKDLETFVNNNFDYVNEINVSSDRYDKEYNKNDIDVNEIDGSNDNDDLPEDKNNVNVSEMNGSPDNDDEPEDENKVDVDGMDDSPDNGDKALNNIDINVQSSKTIAPNIPQEIFFVEINKIGVDFPRLSDIKISNQYWQHLSSSTGVDMYLFSAFYDARKMFKQKAFVRVLAMVSYIDEDFDTYCKLWFKNKESKSILAIAEKKAIKTKGGLEPTSNPYIFTCEVPLDKLNAVPFAVSLIETKRDKATNVLRVINNEPENGLKEDFALCHKGLNFPYYDISIKLVEWIELLRIMGASKISFYDFNVHPNISKVLQYYKEDGLVEVSPLTLPGDQPNTPKELNAYFKSHFNLQLSHEKLPYNDCYFKNMNKYKYILNMDLDEMLIPTHTHTWKGIMDIMNANVIKKQLTLPSQYSFERYISLDSLREPHGYIADIPKYMYMLQNIYRAKDFRGGPKSFFNTDVANHTSTHKAGDQGKPYKVPVDLAYIIHYRSSCKGSRSKEFVINTCDPKKAVMDKNILRYKDELIKRTSSVLKALELT